MARIFIHALVWNALLSSIALPAGVDPRGGGCREDVRALGLAGPDKADSLYREGLQRYDGRIVDEPQIEHGDAIVWTYLYAFDGKLMGKIKYRIEHGNLEVFDTFVDPELRDMGINTFLFARCLALNFPVRRIKQFLGDVNHRKFLDAVDAGKERSEAATETPAFKILRKVGFSRVVPAETNYFLSGVALVTERDSPAR